MEAETQLASWPSMLASLYTTVSAASRHLSKGLHRTVACIVIAICWVGALPALDPTLAVSQYARKHWKVEDGLPQNYVTSITQEPGGLLLVGTSGGVARFDGLHFEPIVLDEDTGFSREWINALVVDDAGNLWIGSRDAGLFLHKAGRTTHRDHPERRLDSMIALRDGAIAGMGERVWRMEDGELRRIGDEGLVDLSWEALLELPDGRLLVGAGAGVSIYDDQKRTLLLPSDAALGKPLSLNRGRSGAVYLGTTTGLFQLDVGAGIVARRMDGVEGPVVSIVEDRDGQVWAATWGRGLYRVRDGKGEQITSKEELSDDFVHTLFEDEEGNLWIGTRVGLSRWKSSPIIPYGPPEGLEAQFVSVIAGDRGDGLWIGSWRSGMHHMRNGRFTRYNLGAAEATTLVRSIATAPDGSLWYADWRKLNHISKQGIASFGANELGHNSSVEAILFDRHGQLWLGTGNGIHVHPNGSAIGPSKSWLKGRHIRCVLEADDGTVWVGAQDGLARLSANIETEVSGLPHADVTALHQDAKGRVWVATRMNGLVLMDGDTPRVFDQRHGFPPAPVYAIEDDTAGNLWFSSPSGLYSIGSEDLDALTSGAGNWVSPVPYDGEDGLRTVEFQNAGFPTSWRSAGGSLWFATVQGLVEVRPGVKHALAAPSVRVMRTFSNDRANEIRFTANRLGSAGHIRFRYRVDGVLNEWISLGAQRVLRLDNLPGGTHRVLLAAREEGGKWGPVTSLSIVQPPHWLETWWFRTLLAGSVALLLWLAYRWRMLILRGRYAAILAERNRISREWHDTLLAGFSAISWQLDATRKRLQDNPQTAPESVELAQKMVRHYRAEARRVVWDLRDDRPESVDLAESIEAALKRITEGSGVAVSVEVEGDSRAMPGELRLNLLRITQEAAGNAFHHAAPSRIAIRIRSADEAVELSVEDDGCGFNPTRVSPGHFGMAIMRERAEKLGGSLTVDSIQGGGTNVRARVPWKH